MKFCVVFKSKVEYTLLLFIIWEGGGGVIFKHV